MPASVKTQAGGNPMPVQTLTMPRARRRARGRTISVFVVDDHPAVRRGVESLLGDQPDLRVAGSASEANAALVDIARLTPRVVVIDYHLSGENGLWLAEQAAQLPTPPRMLIYSPSPTRPSPPPRWSAAPMASCRRAASVMSCATRFGPSRADGWRCRLCRGQRSTSSPVGYARTTDLYCGCSPTASGLRRQLARSGSVPRVCTRPAPGSSENSLESCDRPPHGPLRGRTSTAYVAVTGVRSRALPEGERDLHTYQAGTRRR